MPPPLPATKRTPEQARATRRANAALREESVQTLVTPIAVTDKQCPKCTGELHRVDAKASVVWEYVQPFFRKRVYELLPRT